ncbi:MAG: MFS transporter [Chloroflexi bacterium]|nr:MFS transporter [Chloroflexota bacterium]
MVRLRKVFFGWWMVLAGAFNSLYAGGVFYYGFGAFFDPIRDEFGWSRATTSLAFSLQRFEGGVMAPVVGFLIDKIGARKLIFTGIITASLGFMLLSRINSLFTFYIAFLVVSAGFSAGFSMPAQAAIVNWFVRRRGMAMGLLMAGPGLSGLLVPGVVWLIDQYQWRTALMMIAFGVVVVGVPAALCMRHRPEPYGYLPDGDPPAEEAILRPQVREGYLETNFERASNPSGSANFTPFQAMRTASFWFLSVGLTFSGMAISALMVHEIPALTKMGYSREAAGLVVTGMTVTSLVGRLGFGWLSDTMDKRYILAVASVLQAIGVFIFANVQSPWLIVPFLLTYGIGYGGPISVRPALLGDYFGSKHFGAIQGLVMTVSMVGGVVGPWFAGKIADVTGSYYLAFLISAAIAALSVPLILFAKPPPEPLATGI